MEHFVKFGSSSLISYPIYQYLYGGKVLNSDIIGRMSLPIVLSVASGLSFLVAETVHNQVFPALHVSEKFSSPASSALNIGANYGAQNVMLGLLNSNAIAEVGQMNLFLAAAASASASSYVYNNFVSPFYGYNQYEHY
jgi:hypothetical protein